MADHLSKMREMRSDPIAVRTVLSQFLSGNVRRPVIVVEGDDDPFFLQPCLIRHYDDYIPYFARGRKAVLAAYEFFKESFLASRDFIEKNVLFFIDKDHSLYLNQFCDLEPRIYVTDFYSIENHIVCEEVLYDICVNTYQFSTEDEHLENIISLYNESFGELLSQLAAPMCLTILARQKGIDINFQNLKIKNLFKINENLTLQVKDNPVEFFRCRFNVSEEVVSPNEVSEFIETIKGTDLREITRGHYVLDLFVQFLENVRTYAKIHTYKIKNKHIRAEDVFRLCAAS